jgi:hypothetical protein
MDGKRIGRCAVEGRLKRGHQRYLATESDLFLCLSFFCRLLHSQFLKRGVHGGAATPHRPDDVCLPSVQVQEAAEQVEAADGIQYSWPFTGDSNHHQSGQSFLRSSFYLLPLPTFQNGVPPCFGCLHPPG